VKPDDAAKLDGAALGSELKARLGGTFDELTFAKKVSEWLAHEAAHAAELDGGDESTPPGRCTPKAGGSASRRACCSRSRQDRSAESSWCTRRSGSMRAS